MDKFFGVSMSDFELIVNEVIEKLKSADIAELKSLESEYLGKNSILTKILKSLSQCPIESRKKIGTKANKTKNIIKNEINKKKETLKKSLFNKKMQEEKIDYSQVFYFPFSKGSFHPIIETINIITSIFKTFGFYVDEGPEIETDWYNFEALNIPQNHPVRDTQDTFYLSDSKELLRTHTSAGQVRIMEKKDPPIKVIIPGRVYRNEASDASHSSIFHQIEGLFIDENIVFTDLKTVLIEFIRAFFSENLDVRFRPSYFQFTEPSAEVDVCCFFCKGKGCRVCKNSGWVEILGCGMVHPKVMRAVNYDFEKYTGYAFGLGIERIAMLKYKIDDIRLLYENDLRFLRQF
jgi:phenylalanyl-tRNA synthetase alpha chain